MLMITLYAEQKKRHRFIEQSFSDAFKERWRDEILIHLDISWLSRRKGFSEQSCSPIRVSVIIPGKDPVEGVFNWPVALIIKTLYLRNKCLISLWYMWPDHYLCISYSNASQQHIKYNCVF